jgi:hypothetical protein
MAGDRAHEVGARADALDEPIDSVGREWVAAISAPLRHRQPMAIA